jgi:hypothetical protein
MEYFRYISYYKKNNYYKSANNKYIYKRKKDKYG